MTNSKLLVKDLVNRIKIDESQDEIESVAYAVVENLFGLSRTAVMLERAVNLGPEQSSRLSMIIDRLNANEPLQYILGEGVFYGRLFNVSPSVLIPRPETEHLIDVVKGFARHTRSNLKILDIGTGSGCIPVTLNLELIGSKVSGVDVSLDALAVAKSNAEKHNARVEFKPLDIVNANIPEPFDVIVSNPPYITDSEKRSMSRNVLDYEPHLALFVPNGDPLIFYRHICQKALQALSSRGMLAVEINERFGAEVMELFKQTGFANITLTRDLSGKDRIVSGIKEKAG